MVRWLGSAVLLSHGVIFNFGSAKVCSPAIVETYFSYGKDIWIDITLYFYLIVLFLLVAILELIDFRAS